MDREKFKTITDKLLLPHHPKRLADKSKPISKPCDDCDRVVKDRTVEFYVRGFGTHRATWIKKCVNCSKKAPISTFPDK
jgi:hypothetical protein